MRIAPRSGESLACFAFAALLAPLALGCASTKTSPSVVQGQLTTLQQQHASLNAKSQEILARANTLDQSNQELETLVAQSKQQKTLADEQLAAVREQLASVTQQLAQTKGDRDAIEKKAQQIAATARKRISASIAANSSLSKGLPNITIPGIETRMDGDVVRVELPTDRIFEGATAQFQQAGPLLLENVAGEILRAYPEQVIGIEGHTDSDNMVNGQMINNHQLSTARAAAVFDYLTVRSRIPPQQLFVVGHGANHPVVSNATPAGKARNRRIELVIYPDKVGQSP